MTCLNGLLRALATQFFCREILPMFTLTETYLLLIFAGSYRHIKLLPQYKREEGSFNSFSYLSMSLTSNLCY